MTALSPIFQNAVYSPIEAKNGVEQKSQKQIVIEKTAQVYACAIMNLTVMVGAAFASVKMGLVSCLLAVNTLSIPTQLFINAAAAAITATPLLINFKKNGSENGVGKAMAFTWLSICFGAGPLGLFALIHPAFFLMNSIAYGVSILAIGALSHKTSSERLLKLTNGVSYATIPLVITELLLLCMGIRSEVLTGTVTFASGLLLMIYSHHVKKNVEIEAQMPQNLNFPLEHSWLFSMIAMGVIPRAFLLRYPSLLLNPLPQRPS